MSSVGTILKHEVRTTLGRVSFWVMTLLVPLGLLGYQLVGRLQERQPANEPPSQPAVELTGYVDQANLIHQIPPGIPASILQAYPDLEAVYAALEQEEISQAVWIPPDYVEKNRLVVIQSRYNPLGTTPEDLFYALIVYNQTGDETLTKRLTQPLAGVETHLLGASTGQPQGVAPQTVSYTVLLVFSLLLITSGGWMLQSVAREKSSRVAEVLLLSLEPRALMLGKIMAFGLVTLLQTAVWMGAAALLSSRPNALLVLPGSLLLPMVLYVGLGYILFASLLGAFGAISPGFREAGQLTSLIILPMTLPMLVNPVLAQSPDGILAVGLSLFPLTAPTAMLARLALSPVPAWQLVASLGILAISAAIAVQVAAGAFQADNLLAGELLPWRRIFKPAN